MEDGVVTGNWTLRGRTAALGGTDVITDWTGTLVERFNLPDTLQVNGRTDDLRPLFELLDGGVTLNDPDGRRFSGLLAELERSGDGTCSLTFESDLIQLWSRDVYPDPAHAWPSQATDYDVQTSTAAETVALHYIDKNVGPGAVAARRVTGLVVPATGGHGGTITTTARFDSLGRLVADIAEAANLHFRIVQDGTDLNVTVTVVTDLSATAKFGTNAAGGPGLLGQDWTYTLRRPEVTRALVAGGGLGAARILRERSDTTAETLWGRRIELLVDQNQTTNTGELDKAGDDALAAGAQPVEITANLLDSPDLPLSDVPLGSLVALDLDGELVVDRLRQITTTFGSSGGPTVSVTGLVGSADAGLTRTQKDFLAMRKAIRRVTSQ